MDAISYLTIKKSPLNLQEKKKKIYLFKVTEEYKEYKRERRKAAQTPGGITLTCSVKPATAL